MDYRDKEKLNVQLQYVALFGVPLAFYGFSKYKKYDAKKTAKVTIIGSVLVLGAFALNAFSGAWSGETYLDRILGKERKDPNI
jgi:hypothetical protein